MPDVQIPSTLRVRVQDVVGLLAGRRERPVGERLLDDLHAGVRVDDLHEPLVAVVVGGDAADAAHLDDVALAAERLRRGTRRRACRRRPGRWWRRRPRARSTAWSTATTLMPRASASLMTGLSASRSAGLTMIALAPDEIRLRMPAICALASPLTLWTSTSSTWPEASACAFTEQIISSRQPLPTSVLLTPILYIFFSPPPLPAGAAAAAVVVAAARGNHREYADEEREQRDVDEPGDSWGRRPSSFVVTGTLQHPCRTAGVLCVSRVEQTDATRRRPPPPRS